MQGTNKIRIPKSTASTEVDSPETAQEVDEDSNGIQQLHEVDDGGVHFPGVAQQHHDALPGSGQEHGSEQTSQPH